MKTADFIREHHACRRGAEWALSISEDMADVWDAMIEQNRYDWLLWAAIQPGVFSDTVVRKLACRFVRETPLSDGRKVWDLLTDERSRKAVEVAERYEDGKATKKELADARNAAYAADRAAYAAAGAAYFAYRAAAKAAYAVDAAAKAAYAVAYDAHAAYAADRAAYAAAADAADAAAKAAYAVAYDAYDAHDADFAAYTAYTAADAAKAAAKSAQVRMIAELGNPFEKGKQK